MIGNKNKAQSKDVVFDVVEQMHEGLQIIDENFCYVYINKAAAQHGKKTSPDELTGRAMMDCYPGIQETEMFSLLKKTMSDNKTRRMENEFKFPDGSKVWFDLLFESHDQGVLIRSLDITERKSVEAQLTHSEKMNALGKLAGGVAHDFNNKLGIMKIYCDMASQLVGPKEKNLQKYINQIYSAIEESTTLTKQLLTLSRKQILELKPMNVNDVIGKLQLALSQMMGESIELKFHLDPNVHEINMDPSQIDQIFLNLIVNAKEAMPNGGTLIIESTNIFLDEEYCRLHPEAEVGEYVVVSLTDNGVGMSAEMQKQIFEPFFSSKVWDGGTGLGLATVHAIIRQARGLIWVYSEEGIGTTFKVYFPKSKQKPLAPRKSNPDKTIGDLVGSETLLLTEDDDMLREAVTEALEGAGYNLFVAATVEEAEEKFAANRNEISLLVTDLILKKSKGNDLAKSLKEKKPDLKILFISGYTENSISHQGILDEDCVLLQKPFSIKSMLEVIRKILDAELVRGVF